MEIFTHLKHKRTNDNMCTKVLAQQLLLLFVRLAPSVACFVESHFDTDFWHAPNRSFYKYVKMLRLRMVVGVVDIQVYRCASHFECVERIAAHTKYLDWLNDSCLQYTHAPSKVNNPQTHKHDEHAYCMAVDCDYGIDRTLLVSMCASTFLHRFYKQLIFSRLRPFDWMNVT